jgi:Ca2+-transporting ATPase
LGTSEKGLPRDEAEKRREKYGPNEIRTDVSVPKWLLFLSQFKEVLVLLLIVAGIISIVIGVLDNSFESIRNGAVMFVIVLINAIIGFVQQYKAGKILERLRELIKSPARVMFDGELSEMSQDQLVPGDIVRLEEGDKVPADMRIIESFNLRTNDFSLTGESMPHARHSNAMKEHCVLADRDNMAYLGTTVASGNATCVVVRTGMQTEMGKVADMTEETRKTRSPLEKELAVLANWLTGIVVVISGILFLVAFWQGFSFVVSMIYALGIAVAAVPQALPAQVTVALSTTSKRLAERNAVAKNLPSVETLGSTTVICTDKTGTLTKNEMTVTTVWFNGKGYEVTGVGYEPKGEMLDGNGEPLSQEQIDEIEIMMDAATMASNAEIHPPDNEHSGWTKLGTRSPQEDEENPELHEFPFDAQRKRMSSVREFGNRQQLAMKGATDSVVSISKSIYRDGETVPITEQDKERITSLSEAYSKRALRVLAIALRPLEPSGGDYALDEVEKDVVFLGLVGMIDPPKDGVKEAIAKCYEANIRIVIMTGDHAITAQAVGKEIGLSKTREPSPVFTGAQMEEMSDEKLTEVLEGTDAVIFSRVAPEDKLRIVKLLEAQGEVVAVTGDGVNDAPALKRAAIGVAMGRTGTDVAKEAAELVLLDDSFPTLVEAVKEGRTIYNNLRKTVLASMTTNAAELVVVLMGLAAVSLQNWAIPILAIQILAIDLLAEIMPLTFLAFDPSSDEMMRSPPRQQKEYIMNKYTSVEVAFLGTLIGVLTFTNFALYMFREGVTLTVGTEKTLHYARATTLTYLTIAYCQFANILSRRYEYFSIFNRNFWTNKILLWSIVASIGLVFLGVYGPYISDFLSFAGLKMNDWLYVLGAATLYLSIFELLKFFKRIRRTGSGSG